MFARPDPRRVAKRSRRIGTGAKLSALLVAGLSLLTWNALRLLSEAEGTVVSAYPLPECDAAPLRLRNVLAVRIPEEEGHPWKAHFRASGPLGSLGSRPAGRGEREFRFRAVRRGQGRVTFTRQGAAPLIVPLDVDVP